MQPHLTFDANAPGLSFVTQPARRRALIRLTPLIDVVFILLIFFMLASSFLDWRAIDMDAPVRAGAGAADDAALLIDITPDGLTLNGEEMTLDMVRVQLEDAFTEDTQQRVLIAPAAGVSLQRLVTVLDAAKAAGAADVQIVTPSEQSE